MASLATSYKFTGKIVSLLCLHCFLFCLQAHLGVWGEDNQLFHSSVPTVTPYIQGICWLQGQRQLFPEGRRWTECETVGADKSQRLGYSRGWLKLGAFLLSDCLSSQTLETVRSLPLFFHTSCFIFSIKQPLCLGVLSKQSWTVCCIDEAQTDYLVWMGFFRATERPPQQ